MGKKVSVIIPTYNRANILARAIDSVLCQTYENFELIIVDDKSQDNTSKIVKEFKDSRIRYYKNEKNLGGSVTRNVGIEKAKCEYIAFLDDDDSWLPTKLEKQISLIELLGPEYCGIYTGIIYYKNSKKICEKIPKKVEDMFKELLWGNCIGTTSTILLKKECLDDVGYFNEELPSAQDRELYLRLARSYKFKALREPLVRHYFHSGKQIFDDHSGALKARKYIYRKYRKEISKDRKLEGKYLYDISIMNLLNNNREELVRNLKRVVKTNPFHIKYYFMSLLIFLFPSIYKKLRRFYSIK